MRHPLLFALGVVFGIIMALYSIFLYLMEATAEMMGESPYSWNDPFTWFLLGIWGVLFGITWVLLKVSGALEAEVTA